MDGHGFIFSLFGPEGPDAVEVVGGHVKPSKTEILVRPKTRKNPRDKSAKAPFNAELADSTTIRRFMEICQAVVPKGILWVMGSSAGGADSVPEQQCVTSSAKATNGALRERRMVFGKFRLLSRPAQKGQRHRVTPSPSGRGVAHQAPAGPLVEVLLIGPSVGAGAWRGGERRSRSSFGSMGE